MMWIPYRGFLAVGVFLTSSGVALCQPPSPRILSPYAPHQRADSAKATPKPPAAKAKQAPPLLRAAASEPTEPVLPPPAPAPASAREGHPAITPAPSVTPGLSVACPKRLGCFPRRCRGGVWRSNLQGKCLGYPWEFEAPPLGATVGQHFHTQVLNGLAARMVLYGYDFECGKDQLNFRGKMRVRELGHLLTLHPVPLVIAHTPEAPGLAEARRLAVLNELAAATVPVSPDRVVIAPPVAHPLTGQEAELIYLNLLQQTATRGEVSTGSVFVGGGAGGGSFAPTGGFSPLGGGGGAR